MIHVSTTCADLDSARAIARTVLKARLAACANITPGIVSLFHWQGRIDEEPEVGLMFKTRDALRTALVAQIAEAHPYDLPVITWESVATTDAAETWLAEETRAAP